MCRRDHPGGGVDHPVGQAEESRPKERRAFMKKFLFVPLIVLLLIITAGTLQSSVGAATPVPPQYPPFPTATVYAPPANSSGVFFNDESGFSIKIPKDVKATNSAPE